MRGDPVSELLDLVQARCVITGGLRAGGEWSYISKPDALVKIDAVVNGSCWVVADDQAPVRLEPGDAVVLCGVKAAVLCSDIDVRPAGGSRSRDKSGLFLQIGGEEPDVTVIGGHIDLDPALTELFTAAFPPVLHAPAGNAEAGQMRRLLERVVEESESDLPGAIFATDQYAQLLLVEVLRTVMGQGITVPPGWLRLLTDPRLHPAVRLMHAEPGRDWRLPELAAAANMSRSHFSHQFHRVSGQPPLTYLSQWRISLAQRALRTSDTTIAALADRLGYASESTFSHAFTRTIGTSPGRYRQKHRKATPH